LETTVLRSVQGSTAHRRVQHQGSAAGLATDPGAGSETLAQRSAAANLGVEVAAANGFVDEILTPAETRERPIRALELHA
jgi:acetyl-CoA carboxylase carboxyltransferase component